MVYNAWHYEAIPHNNVEWLLISTPSLPYSCHPCMHTFTHTHTHVHPLSPLRSLCLFSHSLSLSLFQSLSAVPSTPTNLRKLFQSENSVTFGWNPGSSTTCNRNYSVSIMNCGTCNQDLFVSRTNVTCDNLEPGQQMQCSVTVQSVSECGVFSAPLTDVFKGTCIFHVCTCRCYS